MNRRDEVRLRDMLDAAHKAQSFATNRTRAELDTDDMFAFAVVRAIEIIGEAANSVSIETRKQLLEVQRHEIIGMRNRIIHNYISVDHDVVWDVVTNDLPPLITRLEQYLSLDNLDQQ